MTKKIGTFLLNKHATSHRNFCKGKNNPVDFYVVKSSKRDANTTFPLYKSSQIAVVNVRILCYVLVTHYGVG